MSFIDPQSISIYRVDTITNHLQDLQAASVTDSKAADVPPGGAAPSVAPPGVVDVAVSSSSESEYASKLIKMINEGQFSKHQAVAVIGELRHKAINILDSVDDPQDNLLLQAELLSNLRQLEKTIHTAHNTFKEVFGDTFVSAVIEFESSIAVADAALTRTLSVARGEGYRDISIVDIVSKRIEKLEQEVKKNLNAEFENMVNPPSEEMKEHIQQLFLPSGITTREDVFQWIADYQKMTAGVPEDQVGIPGSVGAGIQVALSLAGKLEKAGGTNYAPTKAVLNTLRNMFIFFPDKLDELNKTDLSLHRRVQVVEKQEHERLRDIYNEISMMDPTHKETYDAIGRTLTAVPTAGRALMSKVLSHIYPSYLL